jgi:uncharacterized protein (TIGR02453 family)
MCHMTTPWAETAATFFAELEQHNDRDWWQASRATHDRVIKPRFLELLGGISGFESWRVYRPNNDTRFQSGKGPYKTFIGAVAERPDGVGVFLQIGAQGLLVGTGIPMPAPDQLQRMRLAIADPGAGDAFEAAIAEVRAGGGLVFGGRWEPLRRVPRGYPNDHPKAEWLRWKGVEVNHRPGLPAWLSQPRAAGRVDQLIARGDPLHVWLGQYVGPSSLTPEERFAPKTRSGSARQHRTGSP